MLIQCEKCSTRYNLDEAKIPGKGAKVTCPTCKHVFIVMKGQGAAAPGAAPASAPPAAPASPTGSTRTPTNPPGKSLLDNFFDDSKTVPGSPFGGAPAPSAPASNLGAGRGIRSWKVRVASGLVYDFSDVATLKAWIAEKKVTTADQISADGATWTVIGTIQSLDAFFGGVPSSPTPTPPPMPSPTGMGAPGPAPMTGFGPAPVNAPAAPAFAAPASPPAGGSLADLFNSPAPNGGADPFAAAPPASANPFGEPRPPTPAPAPSPFGGAPAPAANPFGGAPAPAANPFGADPFASAPPAAAGNPFGGPDPVASAPPPAAAPFAGGADPFAAAPAAPPSAPAVGGDPFASPPGASAPPAMGGGPFPGGADPFAAGGDPFSAGAPFGAGGAPASPPPMMGPKPAPPPWLSGPAPASAPPPPTAAPVPPPFEHAATAKPNTSWSSAGEVTAKPAEIPTGKSGRKLGRTVGLALGGIAVLGVAGGLFMNLDRVQAMFRPVPTPAPTPTPPPIVLTLDGEARDHYLRGRRLLRLDTAEAYAKAEQEFRDALAKANANPKATAGVLEALALQKQAGAAIEDAKLAAARDAAILALREEPQSVETNRALAQAAAVGAAPQEAMPYLETALASRPTDAEALFLRAKLRSADATQAAAAAEDLAKAAADTTLTRAVLLKAEGAKPKSPEKKAADELAAANAATLAALASGTWSWTPEEFEKLLPGAAVPTPSAAPATPAPTESAVAGATATPAATSAAPTPTAVAVTPTPAKTPVAAVSATPAKTPIAAASAAPSKTPKPARTPLAATTGETFDETPVPTPVSQNTQIATASAADHFMAGQAFEQAASYGDAIAEYQQAVKLAPKNSQYKLGLAGAQMRGRKFQDAATTLADILDVEPNNAGARRLLGLLFDTTGQSANACAEFSEYLRLKPQAADAGDIRTRMLRNGCQ